MELLFRWPNTDGSETLVDWIVDHACRGSPVPIHGETRFSNGRCFSATKADGCRWLDTIVTTKPGEKWEVVPVPVLLMRFTEQVAIDFANSIVGEPYDVQGAINSGLGVSIRDANKWFCSLTQTELLSRVGIYGVPRMLSPAGLYLFSKRLFAGETAKVLAACVEFQTGGAYRETI
jgi:hypothetical protein